MILQMRFPESASAVDPTAINPAAIKSHPNQTQVTQTQVNQTQVNETFRISCGDCRMVETSVCDDCVVTHLLDRFDEVGISATRGVPGSGIRPVAPVVLLDVEELSTLRMLQAAGMAPQNRHIARHPSARSTECLVAV